MLFMQITLIGAFIALGVLAFYYQLQAQSYLKNDRTISLYTKGWVFHPEYLEVPGRAYRKKLIVCWMVGVFLVAGIVLIDQF